MANTLTGLYPIIYNAMNVVSREQIGFIPAVSRDATAEQAAKDQVVRSPVVPAMAAKNTTPGNIAASGDDQTIDYVDIEITKSRHVDFNLTGEEERGLGGSNATIAQQRFEQAFRTLSNEIESDLASAGYLASSRAYGTAGTTPFGTGDDLTDLTEVMRILDDNGAPKTDRHAVLGSAAGAKLLGKQPAMFKVNEAGNELARRQGEFSNMFGASLHISNEVGIHTKGTGTAYDANGGEPIGETDIVLDGGTAGATGIVAGDVVTFAGDDNKYIVNTGLAAASGTLVLNKPGLIETLADATEMTIGNNYTYNLAFSRDAIQLAARVPAVPSSGDQADDRMYVTDPVSGLTFEIAVYRQFRQVTYFVGIAWGVKAVKSEHIATLLG